MPLNDIYEGQIRKFIHQLFLNGVAVNDPDALITFRFQNPALTPFDKTGIRVDSYALGFSEFETVAGFLAPFGKWKVQTIITLTGGKVIGPVDLLKFEVFEALPAP